MKVIRAVCRHCLARNGVLLLFLVATILPSPARGGILLTATPCLDFSINLPVSCVSVGVCVNSDGLSFIEMFAYCANTCTSPCFNEVATFEATTSLDALQGEIQSIIILNGKYMQFVRRTINCDGVQTTFIDFFDPSACSSAPTSIDP